MHRVGTERAGADLQQVSTLTNAELRTPSALGLLPDGRLLVGGGNRIRVLEGFPAAILGTKPSHKPPKKKNHHQQQTKKRALPGGASSSGLVPKRSRSGASSSAAAAVAASSRSDSEGEEQEQPGGSAAEAVAEPLV